MFAMGVFNICDTVSPPTVVAGDAVVVAFALSCDGAKKVACVDSQINVPFSGPTAVMPIETQAFCASSKNLH